MSIASYRDILEMLYQKSEDFKTYVDHWCLMSDRKRLVAWENADVQRKARDILEKNPELA